MNQIEQKLEEMLLHCPHSDKLGDASFVESSKDVPKLVQSVRAYEKLLDRIEADAINETPPQRGSYRRERADIAKILTEGKV